MLKLGFSSKWVDLIMQCITTASFSVVINGIATGTIHPQRGLRQGCPLSPYLFLMYAEAFSSLLEHVERQKLLHRIQFGKGVKISHLLFADDSLIFTRATREDCKHLKALFECYGKAFGQIFNFEKSSMSFSGSTKNEQISAIKDIFQLQVVSRHEKYLGLPSMIGRMTKSFFKETKLKVLDKICSWQHKQFSSGGKKVLIKVVAQATPSYAMSVFKIPIGICEDIQKAVAKFWWGTDRQKKGIHWAKWERMSYAKVRGGLGFRDLSSFNQALVAKQGWRIMQSPNSLVAKVLKARYFKHEGFMNARLGSKPSFIWRSVLWGRQVIQQGSRWRIGNGENVKMYKSNWIPKPSTFRPISAPTMAPDTTVAELIDNEQHWKEKLICDHFRAEDAKAISQILLPRRPHDDQLIWHYDKRGQYSVKSGYQVAMQMKFPDKPSCSTRCQWNVIWKLSIPEKIKIFLWRAAHDLLPTAGNLWKRRILQESTCQICCCKMESTSHALIECKMAKKIWTASQITVDPQREHNQDIIGLLQVLPQLNANIEGALVAALLWAIWNARNKWLFEGKKENSTRAVARAESVIESFRKVKQPETNYVASQRAVEQKQWCPPPRDWLKINVDAAVDAEK